MKRMKEIIKNLRKLPEGQRKLVAILFVGGFAAIIFSIWLSSTPSKLYHISLHGREKPTAAAPPPVSPAKGILDSLKSMRRLVEKKGSTQAARSEAFSKTKETFANAGSALDRALQRAAKYVYEKYLK